MFKIYILLYLKEVFAFFVVKNILFDFYELFSFEYFYL